MAYYERNDVELNSANCEVAITLKPADGTDKMNIMEQQEPSVSFVRALLSGMTVKVPVNRFSFSQTKKEKGLRWDRANFTLFCDGEPLFSLTSRATRLIAIIETLSSNGWKTATAIPEWDIRNNKPGVRKLDKQQIKLALSGLRERSKGRVDWHVVNYYGVRCELK